MPKYKAKTIIAAVLIVLVVIIILQNLEPMETQILFAKIQMSRALLLFITFALGAITGLLLANKIARPAKPKNNQKP